MAAAVRLTVRQVQVEAVVAGLGREILVLSSLRVVPPLVMVRGAVVDTSLVAARGLQALSLYV